LGPESIPIISPLFQCLPSNVLDHATRIIGQKVDFTRNVKVLYGFSDTSRSLDEVVITVERYILILILPFTSYVK
jgi:hypothetical protein